MQYCQGSGTHKTNVFVGGWKDGAREDWAVPYKDLISEVHTYGSTDGKKEGVYLNEYVLDHETKNIRIYKCVKEEYLKPLPVSKVDRVKPYVSRAGRGYGSVFLDGDLEAGTVSGQLIGNFPIEYLVEATKEMATHFKKYNKSKEK